MLEMNGMFFSLIKTLLCFRGLRGDEMISNAAPPQKDELKECSLMKVLFSGGRPVRDKRHIMCLHPLGTCYYLRG